MDIKNMFVELATTIAFLPYTFSQSFDSWMVIEPALLGKQYLSIKDSDSLLCHL